MLISTHRVLHSTISITNPLYIIYANTYANNYMQINANYQLTISSMSPSYEVAEELRLFPLKALGDGAPNEFTMPSATEK